MKKLLVAAVLSLLLGMTGISVAQPSSNQDRSRLVGAWRLAWLEQTGADGRVHRINCRGMFVFTSDGHLSVQVMQRGAQAQTSTGPEQYSEGGYEASYGTYKMDDGAHIFTFHVEGALVPSLVGKDLPRMYEFSGKQLIVKPTSQDEHWRVVWERY